MKDSKTAQTVRPPLLCTREALEHAGLEEKLGQETGHFFVKIDMKDSYIGLPSYDRLSFEAHDALRQASYVSKAIIDRIGRGC